MDKKISADYFFDSLVKEGLYSNKRNLKMMLNSLFKNVDFSDKKFIEVGGGNGICSFYAALRGSKKVICLEPEGDGSTQGVVDKFNFLNNKLTNNTVILKQEIFQSYNSEGEKFDIILLNNSINHLDENACMHLLEDSELRIIYKELFTKIWEISNNGAKIIICDCSRYNFFDFIKIRNPFTPTIEWYKHQAPEVWINMLSEVGFVYKTTRWSSFNTFGNIGKLLFGNKFMAYFLLSHFCISLEKQ
jgi:hypothetical protein